MKKTLGIFFILFILQLSNIVYASNYEVNRGEGSEIDDIIISGNSNQRITITVVEAGSDISNLSVQDIYCLESIEPVGNGDFEFHWLPLDDGIFDIYISNVSSYEQIEDYYYFSSQTKNSLCNTLKLGTEAEIIALFANSDNLRALEQDMVLYESITQTEDIGKNFYAIREGLTEVQKQDITKYIKISMVEALLQKEPTANALDSLVNELESIGEGFPYKSFYNENMNSTYKGYMATSIASKIRGTFEQLQATLKDNLVLSGVNCELNWAALNKYISLLGYTPYDNYSYKSKVDELISTHTKTSKFNDIQSLKQFIDSSITTVNQTLSSNTDRRPSGGGGGGGVVTYPILTPSNDTANDEEEKNQTEKIAFNDVKERDWFYDAVNYLKWKGVVQGYLNDFNPNQNVTRAEFVIMLHKAFNTTHGEMTISFEDVTENDWYYESIMAAASAGLINGDGNKFYPNQAISRQDMAVMVWRFAENSGVIFENSENNFSDENIISEYAKEAVKIMAGNNIVNGVGDNCFSPLSNATRAQAAQIIYNVIYEK